MRHTAICRWGLAVSILIGVALKAAYAWHGGGHDVACRGAAAALPASMLAFLRAGADAIAHCSADPDLFRLRDNVELRSAEAPEHFIDLELLGGADLPADRYAFAELCRTKGVKPEQVGMVPYAVVEWTQRLTIALAEHRKWPRDQHIRAKCLVYAGLLGHYAQDLCQPLHTTIHYDGRVGADGSSPRSGVHAKVDALLEKAAGLPGEQVMPVAFARLLPAVVAEMRASHALVDEVYRIELSLPGEAEPLVAGTDAAAFAVERLAACRRFTASLYLTAWENSAAIALPDWHTRRPAREALATCPSSD